MKVYNTYFFIILFSINSYAQDSTVLNFFDMVHEAMSNHNYKLAITYCDSLLHINPTSSFPHYQKGSAQFALGDYNAALQTSKEGLIFNPKDYGLQSLIENVYYYGAFNSEFLAIKKAQYKLKPNDINVITDYAFGLYNIGNYEKALDLYVKADSLAPNNLDVLYYKSLLLKITGNEKVAKSLFEKIVSEAGENYYLRLLALNDLGQTKQALRTINNLLETNQISSHYYLKAIFLENLNDYKDAKENYKTGLAFDEPHTLPIISEVAYCDIRLENYETVLDNLKPIIDEYPHYYYASVQYCRALIGLKEYEKAKSMINAIIDLAPLDPSAYFVKGLLFTQLNKADIACENFHKAKERYFTKIYPNEKLENYLKNCKN